MRRRRNPLAERVAFALVDAVRGLGLETGVNLALALVYARYEAVASANETRAQEWHELRNRLAHGIGVGEVLDRLFDPSGPRPAQLGSERLEGAGGRPLLVMLDVLEQLPDPAARSATRELHSDVFETLLDAQVERAGKTSGDFRTPPWMADLTVALCADRPLGRVLDPACGFGETLLHVGMAGTAVGLTGWDISAEAAGIARMRLALAGAPADVRQLDALAGADEGPFDTVLLQPPWSMSLRDVDIPDLPYGLPPRRSLDLAWAQRALGLLTRDGTAAVHLPAGPLFRGGAEATIRSGMLRNGVIEAVIGLPEGMAFSTRVRSALVLLRTPHDGAAANGPVLMVDAANLGVLASRSEVQLAETDVQTIVDCVRDWRRLPDADRRSFNVRGLAGAVPADVLVEDEARLMPEAHVQRASQRQASFPEPPGRLLGELRLQNFKSFGSRQAIRLAPITLLYGPNAAGKSSVIQSLLLLRQSLAAGRLVTQGLANLGSFEGLVHRHDRDRALEIGVTFSAPLKAADPAGMANPAVNRSADLRFSADPGGRARQDVVTLTLDGTQVVFAAPDRRSEGNDGLVVATDQMHRLLTEVSDGLLYRGNSHQRPLAPEEQQRDAQRRERRLAETTKLLRKHFSDGVSFSQKGLFPGDAQVDVEDYVSGVGQGAARVAVIRNQLRDAGIALGSIRVELTAILDNMAWLGPLRSAPERFYARSEGDPTTGLGARGEHVAMHLYDNQTEVAVVNEWFEKLEIPYELRVVPVFAGDRTPTVGDLVAIVLRDKRLNVDTSPADVGFGISQILPIVVQLLASQESVVTIEQPEIHLHPRLQAEIADLVIATTSAAERANQVIIETHSEHLLLRLQRRIREGTLSADDVSVVYIDLQDGDEEARALQLRLDAKGYFLDEWPQGFFDERMDELFGDGG